MIDSKDESVLCFESKRLDELQPNGRIQGFTSDLSLITQLFSRDTKFSFIPRSQCEEDPTYKQVIPYSIIQYGKTKEDCLIFSYVRGKSGGEDRLKKKRSLGIGGHISESVLSNRTQSHPFRGGQHNKSPQLDYAKWEAFREIEEEIKIKSYNPLLYLCGIINDDSDFVGSVHFGLVYRMLLTSPDVEPNEDCISEGEMTSVRDIINHSDEYESWSRLIIGGMKFCQ